MKILLLSQELNVLLQLKVWLWLPLIHLQVSHQPSTVLVHFQSSFEIHNFFAILLFFILPDANVPPLSKDLGGVIECFVQVFWLINGVSIFEMIWDVFSLFDGMVERLYISCWAFKFFKIRIYERFTKAKPKHNANGKSLSLCNKWAYSSSNLACEI